MAAKNSEIMEGLMRRTEMRLKLATLKSNWVGKERSFNRSESAEKEVCEVNKKYQKMTLNINRRITNLVIQKNKLKLL